jgi:hypothetical protein
VGGDKFSVKPLSDEHKHGIFSLKLKSYKSLYAKLVRHCDQLPVLGFNSAKYDMNLIKSKLAAKLGMDTTQQAFVVKRNNSYSCISSESFKFLDVASFLAPGCSYDKFIKAYDCELTKRFFCYEYLSSVEKLDETSYPHMLLFSPSCRVVIFQ